jgi:sugar lactone lactonase YvrE
MVSKVDLAIESNDILGECPLWDDRQGALLWIDIEAPALKRFDGRLHVVTLPEKIGSFALRSKGGLVAALQSGIYLYSPEEAQATLLSRPEDHREELRFNDGRCDRAGRFWAGSMNDATHAPEGSLYRFNADGSSTRMRKSISVPNSLSWSPDGRTMYFADSPRHKIWAFDYDQQSGEMLNERIFATPYPAFPDGSCVDADGCLWNAEYGGARVVRYTPQGKVDRVIEVPAENPTCCCFGGARLDTLYITTARGPGVLAVQPGSTGLPEARFAG